MSRVGGENNYASLSVNFSEGDTIGIKLTYDQTPQEQAVFKSMRKIERELEMINGDNG